MSALPYLRVVSDHAWSNTTQSTDLGQIYDAPDCGDDILFARVTSWMFAPVGDWDAIVFSEVFSYLAVTGPSPRFAAIPRPFHRRT